jgi:hypothetical protein
MFLVFGETGEQWPEYCNRMQHESVWAGIPELVASAQIYRACIRVFANVGPGRFHLWAVLGEKMSCVINASRVSEAVVDFTGLYRVNLVSAQTVASTYLYPSHSGSSPLWSRWIIYTLNQVHVLTTKLRSLLCGSYAARARADIALLGE